MVGDWLRILVGSVVLATVLVALAGLSGLNWSSVASMDGVLRKAGDDPDVTAQTARCWRHFVGDDGGFTEITLALSPDGTYRRNHVFTVSAGAPAFVATAGATSERGRSKGRWMVADSTLTLTQEGHAPRHHEMSLGVNTLVVGERAYLPCR